MISIDLNKKLKGTDGVMDLHLKINIEKGQFLTIYGDSGAGKTSSLRMLAGLLKPDKGTIVVNGETWFDYKKNINLSPQKRDLAFVFQDYALFPNMTVRENLEFTFSKRKLIDQILIDESLEIMELAALQNRKPETLSGGQKQRVALARALVQKPKILLLDEPMAALNIKIRMTLQDYLQKIHREYNLTTILISHDISEIMKLSNRVLELKNGQILKDGKPSEIFLDQQISGKFKFSGEVLKIEKQEVVYIVTVLIQQNIVQVIAQDSEVQDLSIGDKVMVASKAFNPIIYKIK